MRKRLLLPLLLAAACDGGGNGPSGSAELTAAEAAELSRAMFSIAAGLTSAGIPSGPDFALSPIDGQNTFTAPIQRTAPCNPSGSTDIKGAVTFAFDDVSMGISVKAEVSVTPKACAHRLENGDIIKITGDPDLDVNVALVGGTGDEIASLLVTETGAFTWTRGGSSGRCTVDITSRLDSPTQVATVSGTFCGFPVSETIPVGG